MSLIQRWMYSCCAAYLALAVGTASAQGTGVQSQDSLPPSEEGFDALETPPVRANVGSASPFTPAAQNTRGNDFGNPFTPGEQNDPGRNLDSASPFRPGSQNQSSVLPNGGSNPWAPQDPSQGGASPQQNFWSQNLPRPADPQFMPLPPNFSNRPILISMPAGEPGACGYVVATGQQSWNYTIAPGKSQTFIEDHVWQVTYDRGSGFGPQTYALRSGHYKFRQSPRGWELYRGELEGPSPVAATPSVQAPSEPAPPAN